jgi:hypothetical protein
MRYQTDGSGCTRSGGTRSLPETMLEAAAGWGSCSLSPSLSRGTEEEGRKLVRGGRRSSCVPNHESSGGGRENYEGCLEFGSDAFPPILHPQSYKLLNGGPKRERAQHVIFSTGQRFAVPAFRDGLPATLRFPSCAYHEDFSLQSRHCRTH